MSDRCDLVVRGDLVLDDRVVADGAVSVAQGRIVGIHEDGASPAAAEVHAYPGRYVLPGLVDTHVHAGSFLTEDLTTTTSAAAAGGVTTIVDMPYDLKAPVMGAARLEEKIGEVEAQAVVDVGLYGTIPKVDGVGAIRELVDGGVCAFKFSLFEYDARRFPRIADGDLAAAFEELAPTGVPIVLHNELQEIVQYRLAQLLGTAAEDDPRSHGVSHPLVSETAASAKALDIALRTGARLHLAHCTHPETFRLIGVFRDLGADVSGETCIHYLVLDEDDVVRLGPIAKVNPPIRDAAARRGLWDGLRDGAIGSISTDHAPFPMETKRQSILRASAGTPGLETFLAALVTGAAEHGLPLAEALGYATWRPAAIFGLGDRKGRLEKGRDADIAVFDPRTPWTYDAAASPTNAGWSPFDGRRFAGRVEATYVRGRAVFSDGRVVAAPGSGAWLRRAAADAPAQG